MILFSKSVPASNVFYRLKDQHVSPAQAIHYNPGPVTYLRLILQPVTDKYIFILEDKLVIISNICFVSKEAEKSQ